VLLPELLVLAPELLPELPPSVLLPELLLVLAPEPLLVLAPELVPEPLVELAPELPVDPPLDPPLLADPLLLAPLPDDAPDDEPLLLAPEPPSLSPPFEGVVVLVPQCVRIVATTQNPAAENVRRIASLPPVARIIPPDRLPRKGTSRPTMYPSKRMHRRGRVR